MTVAISPLNWILSSFCGRNVYQHKGRFCICTSVSNSWIKLVKSKAKSTTPNPTWTEVELEERIPLCSYLWHADPSVCLCWKCCFLSPSLNKSSLPAIFVNPSYSYFAQVEFLWLRCDVINRFYTFRNLHINFGKTRHMQLMSGMSEAVNLEFYIYDWIYYESTPILLISSDQPNVSQIVKVVWDGYGWMFCGLVLELCRLRVTAP